MKPSRDDRLLSNEKKITMVGLLSVYFDQQVIKIRLVMITQEQKVE